MSKDAIWVTEVGWGPVVQPDRMFTLEPHSEPRVSPFRIWFASARVGGDVRSNHTHKMAGSMNRQDDFHRMVVSIHEATFNDAIWPEAAALIDETCGIVGHQLVVGEGFGEDVQIYMARFYNRGQRRQDLERLYYADYHAADERIPRARLLPNARLVHVNELFTEEERRTSRVYNEGLVLSSSQNSLNVRLDGPDGCRIGMALGNPIGIGGWENGQIETIQRVLPHVRQLVRVRQALHNAEAYGASLTHLLGNSFIGVINLGRSGNLLEMNDRARGLLLKGDGLFDQGGHLHARLPADEARLQRLLASALPVNDLPAASGSMTVRRASKVPRLTVHVMPASGYPLGYGLWRVAAIVLIVEPGGHSHVDSGLVAAVLGLTPAEGRIAALLAGGHTVRNIASMTGTKESSIRSHMKRIYSKRGISRQADLIRLVLSIARPR